MNHLLLFTLEHDYTLETGISVKGFHSFKDANGKVVAEIHPDGCITVFAGYTWDGASPKFRIKNKVYGTWDGYIVHDTFGSDLSRLFEDGEPQLYYPTLIHDLLYRHLHQSPYSRRQADQLFLNMMREVGFKYAKAYYLAVRWLGGVYMRLSR